MMTTKEIKSFMLNAVRQRRRLIANGKSKTNNPNLNSDLVFLQAYAEEINQKNRMAKFYINHYTELLKIAPPTWAKKAQQLYDECQLIINQNI